MSLSFLAAAREAGERVAVVDSSGAEHTFAELAPRVAATAGWLDERLARPAGDERPRVAMVGSRSLAVLVALWSLLERGVPFALLHPRWAVAERRRLVTELGCSVLLDEGFEMPPPSAEPTPGPPPDDERCCAVVFTSGTSGRPKAAALSRRAFVAAARASEANLGWRADDRWLLSMPLAHVGGLSIVVRCLLARRAVVLGAEGRFEPRGVAAQVARDRVTLLSFVPTMLWRMLEMAPPWRPPRQVRAILLGGAPAGRRLLCRAADAGLPVLTTYGLTEACSQVTTQPLGTVNRGQLGVGFPVEGVELRLAGGERDVAATGWTRRTAEGGGPSGLLAGDGPVEPGGTIEIRGSTLFSGYLGEDPPCPLTPDGWLRTGDVGYLDAAGALHVLGRCDETIISGGENVAPLVVEEVLEGHPSVERACVFAVEDEEWGEVVAAALVARAAGPAADGELRELLASRLAPHERPRLLCWVASLDESPSGKLDRRATRDRCARRLRRLGSASGRRV